MVLSCSRSIGNMILLLRDQLSPRCTNPWKDPSSARYVPTPPGPKALMPFAMVSSAPKLESRQPASRKQKRARDAAGAAGVGAPAADDLALHVDPERSGAVGAGKVDRRVAALLQHEPMRDAVQVVAADDPRDTDAEAVVRRPGSLCPDSRAHRAGSRGTGRRARRNRRSARHRRCHGRSERASAGRWSAAAARRRSAEDVVHAVLSDHVTPIIDTEGGGRTDPVGVIDQREDAATSRKPWSPFASTHIPTMSPRSLMLRASVKNESGQSMPSQRSRRGGGRPRVRRPVQPPQTGRRAPAGKWSWRPPGFLGRPHRCDVTRDAD